MGQHASLHGYAGATIGANIGVLGGVVGISVLGGGGVLLGAIVGLVNGDVKGCMEKGSSIGAFSGFCLGASVMGLPSGLFGAFLGVTIGSMQDLYMGVDHVARVAAISRSKLLASRRAAGLRKASINKARSAADLPREAKPLLLALIMAQRSGALSEEDVLHLATRLAVVAVESPSALAEHVEHGARQVLMLVHLHAWYGARWSSSQLQEIAKNLLETTTKDTLDAVLLASAAGDFSEEILPSSPDKLDVAQVRRMLATALNKRRPSALERLRHHFPGHTFEAYETCFDALTAGVLPAELWRVCLLLQEESLPREVAGVDIVALPKTDVVERVKQTCGTPFLSDVIDTSSRGMMTVEGPPMPSHATRATFGHVTFHTTGPFTSARQPSDWALEVDVLCVEDLGSPEHRLGDFLTRCPGGRLRVYAEVHVGGAVQQTRPVLGACGGRVEFGESLRFTLGRGHADQRCCGAVTPCITVRLLAANSARRSLSALRGDPVIGELQCQLPDVHVLATTVLRLGLLRDGEGRGTVAIRCGVLAPASAYEVISSTEVGHSLSEKHVAFANVLAQPRGVEMLFVTRPTALDGAEGAPSDSRLRRMLRGWIRKSLTYAIRGRSDPATARTQALRAARAAREIVAACAPILVGKEVDDLTVAWAQAIVSGCAGDDAVGSMHRSVLRGFLAEAMRTQEDVRDSLLCFGLEASRSLSLAEESAVVELLKEAEANNLDELFTGESIFDTDGHVRVGMSVVLRRVSLDDGCGEEKCHGFLYDHAGIQEWLRVRMVDPVTRDYVDESQIVQLSRVSE